MTAGEIRKTLQREFVRTIRKPFVDAVKEYDMVRPGDRVAVCISGGKDSMLLGLLLRDLQHTVDFELKFLAMDPGYAPEGRRHLEENARKLDIPLEIFDTDVLRIAGSHSAEHPCFLCAKMRRGYLYAEAKKRGCNKIALGHHYDDAIGTVLMGLIYGGQVQAMLPRVKAKNYEGMELIRPLYLVREDAIKAWRDYNDLHFIQCACKFTDTCTTCNNEENQSKRMEIKKLIAELKKTNPFVEGNIFKSVENVNLDTIIAYKKDRRKVHFLDEYDEKEENPAQEQPEEN